MIRLIMKLLKNTLLLIFISTLFVGVLAFLNLERYPIVSEFQDIETSRTTPAVSIPPIETYVPIETMTPTPIGNLKPLKEIIRKFLDGEVVFNKNKYNVEIYKSDDININKYLDGQEGNFVVLNSYKYYPGAKFNAGYEEVEWILELDKWKKYLESTDLGKREMTYYGEWGEGKSLVEVKYIGSRKYSIRNWEFRPSGSNIRYYSNFNSKSNIINEIVVISDINFRDKIEYLYESIENILP